MPEDETPVERPITNCSKAARGMPVRVGSVSIIARHGSIRRTLAGA